MAAYIKQSRISNRKQRGSNRTRKLNSLHIITKLQWQFLSYLIWFWKNLPGWVRTVHIFHSSYKQNRYFPVRWNYCKHDEILLCQFERQSVIVFYLFHQPASFHKLYWVDGELKRAPLSTSICSDSKTRSHLQPFSPGAQATFIKLWSINFGNWKKN